MTDEHKIIDPDLPDPHDERVEEILEHTIDVSALAPEVSQQEPVDAADTLERLEPEERSEVLDLMEDEAAALALSEMVPPVAAMAVEDLAPADAAKYLGLMDPDDAADLLQELDQELIDAVMPHLPRDVAEALITLATYDADTAGGIMTTEFVSVRDSEIVTDAIAALRESEHLDDDTTYIFVTSDGEHLVGVVSLLDLLLANRAARIDEIMDTEVDAIRASLDQEDVATEFDRHDHIVLPVLSDDDRLVGIITVDDVIDIIREENTEDTQKMVGAAAGEAVYTGLWQKLTGRFPWLMVNLVTSFVAAIVVLQFSDLIGQLAILAVLMPVIANQAGNAGQQSLAVTFRGLVLGEVRSERVWPLLGREMALGFITGLFVGGIVALMIFAAHAVWPEASWQLGIVAGVAMTGALTVGCLVGTGIPLLMNRLGFDPATASTIFLTMMTDSISFLTFLGLAWLLRGWIPGGA
ncbi:MAG: magnesium transporter [Phycisphaerales bacterium]|nr:magnesium transporter [Phycisphaerales bacterium]